MPSSMPSMLFDLLDSGEIWKEMDKIPFWGTSPSASVLLVADFVLVSRDAIFPSCISTDIDF